MWITHDLTTTNDDGDSDDDNFIFIYELMDAVDVLLDRGTRVLTIWILASNQTNS